MAAAIVRQAAELGVSRLNVRGRSLIKVAELIGNFQFPRPNDAVQGIAEVPVLFLATTGVEFRMREASQVATMSQVRQWLEEVLVSSELDDSIERLAGRTIGSLCAQKLLMKIGTRKYRLIDAQ